MQDVALGVAATETLGDVAHRHERFDDPTVVAATERDQRLGDRQTDLARHHGVGAAAVGSLCACAASTRAIAPSRPSATKAISAWTSLKA